MYATLDGGRLMGGADMGASKFRGRAGKGGRLGNAGGACESAYTECERWC